MPLKLLLFVMQVVWLGTCIAAILLGLDLGLAAGLGVELLSVVLRTQLSVFSFVFTFFIICDFIN